MLTTEVMTGDLIDKLTKSALRTAIHNAAVCATVLVLTLDSTAIREGASIAASVAVCGRIISKNLGAHDGGRTTTDSVLSINIS